MTRLSVRSVATFALALAAALPAARGDETAADASKGGGRWTLKLEHGPLKIVPITGRGGMRQTYHYMTLKVTNPTSHARPWNPLVEAVTDTKKTTLAVGYLSALEAVRAAEKDPTLQAVETTTGKIEPGETKNLVAILGRLDPNYDRVEIRIHGLVNPITSYKVEIYGEGQEVIVDAAYWTRNQELLGKLKAAAKESGGSLPQPQVEYREIRESRVWAMTYERTGDEFGRDADPIRLVREDWKVLGDPQTLRVIDRPGAGAATE
jgi:hypothetical protein